jgi:hypothetical protein
MRQKSTTAMEGEEEVAEAASRGAVDVCLETVQFRQTHMACSLQLYVRVNNHISSPPNANITCPFPVCKLTESSISVHRLLVLLRFLNLKLKSYWWQRKFQCFEKLCKKYNSITSLYNVNSFTCISIRHENTPCFMHSFIRPFIQYSALRQIRSLFQNKFSTECDLVLPLSTSSTVSFP